MYMDTQSKSEHRQVIQRRAAQFEETGTQRYINRHAQLQDKKNIYGNSTTVFSALTMEKQ